MSLFDDLGAPQNGRESLDSGVDDLLHWLLGDRDIADWLPRGCREPLRAGHQEVVSDRLGDLRALVDSVVQVLVHAHGKDL